MQPLESFTEHGAASVKQHQNINQFIIPFIVKAYRCLYVRQISVSWHLPFNIVFSVPTPRGGLAAAGGNILLILLARTANTPMWIFISSLLELLFSLNMSLIDNTPLLLPQFHIQFRDHLIRFLFIYSKQKIFFLQSICIYQKFRNYTLQTKQW